MFNPAHPGEVIRELCIEPLELTVTEAAKALGVTRKTLSELLNGHSRISPEMAIKTSAESWINQQAKYDLWLAEKNRSHLNVKCLVNHAA